MEESLHNEPQNYSDRYRQHKDQYENLKKKEKLASETIDDQHKKELQEDGFTVYPGPTEEMITLGI